MNKEQKFLRIVAKEMLEDLSNWFEELAEMKFKGIKTPFDSDEEIKRIEKICKGPIENARMNIDFKKVKKMINEQYNLEEYATYHFDYGKTFNENIKEYERKREQVNQDYHHLDHWEIQNYDNLKWIEYFVEQKIISFEQYKV